MSYSCAEWRGDIGAYIVGALDARARTQVRRHLAACAGCRAEYDDLVPVRAWLGRLALAGGRPDTGPPLGEDQAVPSRVRASSNTAQRFIKHHPHTAVNRSGNSGA